jgi:integrase/recombinase XerD
MKKMKMTVSDKVTFEDGCNKYLDNCRQRNLREGTINHYKQSYTQFYKYFDADMPVEEFTSDMYKQYVVYLRNTLQNDVSINSYLRDLITTLHFFMNEGYIPHFKMQAIKVDKSQIETYTEAELKMLLKKPNIKKCNFTEYESWIMTNFLFSTGVRQRSLMHIKVKDVDFDNNIVYVSVTKSRKPLIVPLNHTMVNILSEYLKYRPTDIWEKMILR